MKCLVTGGCGFIGSHLAYRLAELGHEVKVFDIEWPEYAQGKTAGGVTYYHRNICDPALHNFRADWVFHLAGKADVIPSIENPMIYHQANVDGTVNVLDHAQRLGCQKFVYASSTSIYGIPNQFPTPEEAEAHPEYPYALTKWVGEEYVRHWGQVYGLPVVALRVTTAYGPGMKSRGAYGSVWKVFLPQKANGAPYTVVGDGSQSRDFVYVSDIVEAFIAAAASPSINRVYNVGSGQGTTIKRLTGLLGDENGVVHVPWRPGEPKKTTADIRRIKAELRWEPRVSIEEGVKIMLDHLDDWRAERVWTPEDIGEATKGWHQCLSHTSKS